MHKPRKRELFILLTAHCFIYLWPINKILPRTDNTTVKNKGLSFLFIAHGLDELYLSGIFP